MTETVSYEPAGTVGGVEIRRYPLLVLASVRDGEDESGFRLLFAFITGSNRARRTIPMTAPVITPVEIAMTAPVISGAGRISFVMPAGMKVEEVPEPVDGRIGIETVPARTLAVARFAGRARPDEVGAVTRQLLADLESAGIATRGAPFLMRYDSPLTPGFLRRNEVAVEIGP